MRKLTQLLSVLILLSLLTACGSGGSSSSTTAQSPSSSTSGTVNLAWQAPTTRADGSYLPVSELAGYRIYMGTSANNLTPIVDLNDESVTQYNVGNLSSGSYFFAVSAYDTDGLEGGISQVVLKQVG